MDVPADEELLMTTLLLKAILDENRNLSLTARAKHHPSACPVAPVLIVEDDPHVRMVLRLVLEAEGYHVIVAVDGAEALRSIRQARPCIVVFDLDLPGICDEQVATEVRGTHGSAVPVIALSAASDGRIRADRAGADRYFAKPFDVAALVEYMAKVL